MQIFKNFQNSVKSPFLTIFTNLKWVFKFVKIRNFPNFHSFWM